METFSDHLTSLERSAPTAHHYCDGCEHEYEELFHHELTGAKLCRECLSDNIANDLKEDDIAYFENWTFTSRNWPYTHVQAVNDDLVCMGMNVAECLEMVMIKMKLI